MRSKITAIILFLLLFPTTAQSVKLEYRYPFYCSKDIVAVFYRPQGYIEESYLFAYEGSPIEITITENEKVTYEKIRLTTPNQYYEIHPQNGGFLTFIIRSMGESTFDMDSGINQSALRDDVGNTYFFGNKIWLSENSLEDYKIRIEVPMHDEKFCFFVRDLEKGEIWIEDYKNETRYGPLTSVSKKWKEYEINTTELAKNKTWYLTFTDLKGAGKFCVSGKYKDSFENYTITVLRPKRFFTTEGIFIYPGPSGPRIP